LTRDRGLNLLVGGLVVLACGIVQLFLLQGPHPFDPAYYFQTAVDFPKISADYWTLRIGLVAPVRAAVLLFGPSEAALYAVPLAAGLLLAGAVYGTMLALFHDRLLGAAAALVTALNPGYLLNSSFIFPDTVATATFTAAFFCLVVAAREFEEHNGVRAANVYALCAGALFGWTYLVREFSPILLPAVAAAMVLLRYPVRRALVVAGAAFATFSLEPLYGLLGYGDPFVRIRTLLERHEGTGQRSARVGLEGIREQLDDPLDSLLVFPRLLLSWRVGWVFLLLLTIFVLGLLRVRDRRLWLLGTWFFSFSAVMVAFGLWGVPSGGLIVNVTNIRYWYPAFPALVMGAVGSSALLAQRYSPSRRAALLTYGVTAALTASVLVGGTVEFTRCAARDVWRNEPVRPWHELRSWLATAEGRRYGMVWSDPVTARLVLIYSHSTFGERLWHGDSGALAYDRPRIVPASQLRRSLILVHKPRSGGRRNRLARVGREWSPLFVSHDGLMILLAHDPVSPGRVIDPDEARSALEAQPTPADPGECGLSPYESHG
jgi:hypothetical protein